MFYNASNNAWSRLSSAISASATSLTVQGGNWPEPPFLISIEDEIIEVNNKSGNTFSNLVRGMEGTTPAPHPANARVENRFTAGTYSLLKDVLTDSRIVEHNLDVANPPNGYYVRWENGLQVCWHGMNIGPPNDWGASYTSGEWTLPAEFGDNLYVRFATAGQSEIGTDSVTGRLNAGMSRHVGSTPSSCRRSVRANGASPTTAASVFLLAIGRWK